MKTDILTPLEKLYSENRKDLKVRCMKKYINISQS